MNDKASYVAKEDSIGLFSVAKETALNQQQIKPCVPLATFIWLKGPCPTKKSLVLPRPKHVGELKMDRVTELLLEGSAI